MPDTYIAGDNNLPGRNGSRNNPYRDPSELPTPWTLVGGNGYWFHGDAPTQNFSKTLKMPAFTSNPITVAGYGSNTSRPKITCVRTVDGSECAEVSLNYTPGNPTVTTTLASGTNLWRVPAEFMGLYAGRLWGVACDLTATAGDGPSKVPSSSRQYTVGSTDGGLYRVVYSEGNPVDVYGALYAVNVSHADYVGGVATSTCIYALQAYGGFDVYGLEFGACGRPTYLTSGNPPARFARMRANNVRNCVLKDSPTGFCWAGGDSVNPPNWGRGHTGVRVEDNYGENLGRSFIDFAFAPYPGSLCLNDTRIARNVGNKFGQSYSSGGIYISNSQTLDGSYITIEDNTLSGGVMGNVWMTDGHGFYSENLSRSQVWRRNFGWNNDENIVSNGCSGEVYQYQNVFFAKPGISDGISRCHVISGGVNAETANMRLTIAQEIAIGFRRFAQCSITSGLDWRVNLLRNIAPCTQSSAGVNTATNTNFLRLSAASAMDHFTCNENNITGHDCDAFGTPTTFNGPPYFNDNISTDPTVVLGGIPIPTDPTVNYALKISPHFWATAVDLSLGPRLPPGALPLAA